MPPSSVGLLSGVSFSGSQEFPCSQYSGAQKILRLKNGSLLIQADLDINADGSPRARTLDPRYGRLETSLRYPGVVGQEKYIDSESIPYFVLPLGFAEAHGIELGDIGAVIYRNQLSFAVFADNGPADKIGEGSIKLAENLGHSPWNDWVAGETFSTHGGISEAQVVYIVFPDSKPEELNRFTLADEIVRIGSRNFLSLGGRYP